MPLCQKAPASFASHRSMPQGERLSASPASTTDRGDDSTVDNKPKADFVHHVSDIVDDPARRPRTRAIQACQPSAQWTCFGWRPQQ